MRWIWLAVGTIAFWAAWFILTAFVMFVHGDCWAGTTDAEVVVCVHQKRIVGLVTLVIGCLIYAFGVWKLRNRFRRS